MYELNTTNNASTIITVKSLLFYVYVSYFLTDRFSISNGNAYCTVFDRINISQQVSILSLLPSFYSIILQFTHLISVIPQN